MEEAGCTPCSVEQGKYQYITGSTQSQNTEQLERTYKKALSDYSSAVKQWGPVQQKEKTIAALRSALTEKEDEAEKSALTLQKYREDIAQQSSFANNRPFGVEDLEELKRGDLSAELERERLKYITNRVNLERLEQKLRKKSDLAGGVSDVEYQRLEEDIKKSDDKYKRCQDELKDTKKSEEQLLRRRTLLTKAISKLEIQNREQEGKRNELNGEIEDKTRYLGRLKKKSQSLKKEIGYDASDIGAFLQTDLANKDFSSSKCELEKLKAEFQLLSAALKT